MYSFWNFLQRMKSLSVLRANSFCSIFHHSDVLSLPVNCFCVPIYLLSSGIHFNTIEHLSCVPLPCSVSVAFYYFNQHLSFLSTVCFCYFIISLWTVLSLRDVIKPFQLHPFYFNVDDICCRPARCQ